MMPGSRIQEAECDYTREDVTFLEAECRVSCGMQLATVGSNGSESNRLDCEIVSIATHSGHDIIMEKYYINHVSYFLQVSLELLKRNRPP